MFHGGRWLALVTCIVCSVSCASPAPTPTADPAPSPTPPTQTVASLEVAGLPADPVVGATAQLTATVRFSDATTKDVTKLATWTVSNASVAAVSTEGVLTALGVGEADISAAYSGASSRATIAVRVRVATFVLSGVVHESAPTTAKRLANARVEVVGGSLDGRSFATDGTGAFSLPPAPASQFLIYFKKAGYDDVRMTIELQGDRAVDVGLAPEYRQLAIQVGGSNDCTDIPQMGFYSPSPSGGGFGWGGRVYARLAVHHDGVINVKSAGLKLPFSIGCCPGYVTKLLPDGRYEYWAYIYADKDLPIERGFEYVITFSGDVDHCREWGMNATAPN